MRLLGSATAIALASLIAVPAAQARPRLGPAGIVLLPLAIVGGVAAAAVGSRKARAHRSYKMRPSARRDRGVARRGHETPARAEPAVAKDAAPTQQGGWAGPLFWPHAYDGVFEYAFGLPGDDGRFWARGFGDVIDGMFLPHTAARRGAAAPASYEPRQSWEVLCGSETPKAADTIVARLREVVQPKPAQEAALAELQAALTRATERIETACPSGHATMPPERLRMMAARLAAMRQAVLAVQGPLRAFYETLDDAQKAALEHSDGEGEGGAGARIAGCAAPVADWPQEQIERVLQPTKAQRAQLEELRQRALGLAQFVAGTCPREMPRTVLARLEAVKDRLAVLRYAASNVSPAFEDFYASLSDAQRARLQSMARERRADSAR